MNAMATYIGTQLAQAGKPLTASQNGAVRTALFADLQRTEQERRTRATRPANEAETKEESSGTYLDAIAPHINAEQLAVLRKRMER